MQDEYVEKILTARVYDVARETPLEVAESLSRKLENQVWLKREDLQPVFSFKLRGAYNKISGMSSDQLGQGVICASAGNHGQGVALAARCKGLRAVIVMPTTTPSIKVKAIQALGGQTISHGQTYDDAYQHALELARQQELAFIHPFDDPDIIAGQGTVGMEILRQAPQHLDAIFVPVGGGGLAAGVATYVKHLDPDTRVIGVEPLDAGSMHAALEAGMPVTLDHVGIFADGVSVRRVGNETFRLCQKYLDEVILVSTDEICAAIKDIFNDTRSISEPAGALALAGLKRYLELKPATGMNLAAIVTGANMNFDRLGHVAERANIGEHTEALFAVEIPEAPGSFLHFCETLGRRVVTEFNYRYGDNRQARIFVGIQLQRGNKERQEVLEHLLASGFSTLDLSDNELAKLHVRHMVGGYGPSLADEHLFRFEFPERPGALMSFLQAIGSRWNISLFHYRNHGSDFGRVLAGVQVPAVDWEDFGQHLSELGYAYWEETSNPAYQMFLGPTP
ncbi:MAG: threonine ammonia-lyase, biosynthetic [Gammaproteobacteria bacterium]|nr:threonine ammonia-lyase, biosynthetic [Gammaproteobacteria bacterium]